MLARVTVPIALLIAGPLIDHVFKPLLTRHAGLARVLGPVVGGTGPGRGIGLLFVLLGLAMLITTLIAAANPRLRAVEGVEPAAPVRAPSPAAADGA